MKEIIIPVGKERRLRYLIRSNDVCNSLYLEYYYVDHTNHGEKQGWEEVGGIALDGDNWVSFEEFANAVQRLQKLLLLK